jgi:uncharacterized repeat protein (TIGR03803 family)
MSKVNWGMRACGIFLLWATAAVALPAQTFTTLHSFANTNGASPWAALVQGTNGDFYGATAYGGNTACSGGCGTVFKITPSGRLTTLHSFDGTDGASPIAGLVLATNGNFYGTTADGGNTACSGGCGTVFKITASGMLTTLHSFDGTDGGNSQAALVQATNGDLYGTTVDGGASTACSGGCGTVFKITASGTLTTLHSFDYTDGEYPTAALIQATNGKFYGTTLEGGSGNCPAECGTVFKITPSGLLTTLHSFDGTDGDQLYAGLVQAANGDFYGTTESGGASACGCGTVFKITPSGTLTTLHGFDNTDGEYPLGGLVQATNGDFYGTTESGGASNACSGGCGTVFKITARGTLTTLHSFDSTDGSSPYAGLVQGTTGSLYGTTLDGGTSNACSGGCGTVFSLSVGLGPSVETNPSSSTVGAAVTILGTNLTGASSVTFNGTAATFTVKSKSEITTKVPTGATTGTVKVVTPDGTLSSNVPFRVMQ